MSESEAGAVEMACLQCLRALGFTVVGKSHAYRLGAAPVHVMVERQRWPDPAETVRRRDLLVFFGSPTSAWAGDELTTFAYHYSQSDQRHDGLVKYPMESAAQHAELVADFDLFTVPALEGAAADPSWLVKGLLDGRLAPRGGRKRSGIAAAEAALSISRAWALTGYDERIVAALRDEASISEHRRGEAERVASKYGLLL